MTTNSFGGALPRFDYPAIQPAVARASRLGGLPITARIVSVAAAAGLAYYATSRPAGREPQALTAPAGARALASSYRGREAGQPAALGGGPTDTIRLRRE